MASAVAREYVRALGPDAWHFRHHAPAPLGKITTLCGMFIPLDDLEETTSAEDPMPFCDSCERLSWDPRVRGVFRTEPARV